ncbi:MULTISPECIES: hypothetical protein [Pseudomonas]|uniref:hypothetical protein n=1 Tax=Pseudomonas TaxID=286 RepID=UPI001BEC2BD8|nr:MULTISPECIES: hypothetical protein [Pseudomonas]MBT2339007.1 hypothetical protein [Pseudomonas fluorescens]MCD4527793.1 hypothetical protein [Pseudomonas sp. C3-2018]
MQAAFEGQATYIENFALVINDNLAESAPDEAATFQAIGIAATICVPLIKHGRFQFLPKPYSAVQVSRILRRTLLAAQ